MSLKYRARTTSSSSSSLASPPRQSPLTPGIQSITVNYQTMDITWLCTILAAVFLLAALFVGMSLRGRSRLQRRLFVLLFLFSFLPAAIVLLVNWKLTQRHLSVLDSPGMVSAFESSLRLARRTLEEEREATRALAVELAAQIVERETHQLPPPPQNCSYRLIRGEQETTILGQGARPAPPAIHDLDPSTWETPARMQFGETDCIVAVAPIGTGTATDSIIILARTLNPDLAADLDAITSGGSRYRQIRLYYGTLLRGDTLITLAVLGIVLLAISLILSRLLARQISEPMMKLVEGTQIVAGGDLDHEVRTHAPDELNDLVNAFNRMTAELKTNKDELLRAERIAAWQGIARRLAHEIKNPLTPIGLSMHVIRRKVDNPEVTECVDAVLEETGNLERLANEFSEYARLPSPKIETIDLAKLIKGVVDLYASRTQVDVRLRSWPDAVSLHADPGLIRQVFSNLIKNAIEAMVDKGTLTLSLQSTDRLISVLVEDTGPGLPASAEEIFEPTFTTKESGTGLGLAISRKIVEDHGGRLTAENAAGGGAVFRIDLPTGQPADEDKA